MKNKSAKVSGTLTAKDREISVDLFVIQFKDDGCYVAYCPALNVYGYGKSEDEARNSFETCITEFFEYAIAKKTLVKELEHLGWTVKKEKKFTSPLFSNLLESNRELKKIMNSREFKKVNTSFSIPTVA
jgi:predicted RNase H-like HicB family nuclease